MKLQILGCSGGIGPGLRTTSFLVDDDVLIDGGTGIGELSLEQMVAIDRVFVTHSHLDHVASIPFLIDAVGFARKRPLTVHGLPETLEALQAHLFNGHLWPDFSVIPEPDRPYLRYQAIEPGVPVILGERRITAVPANHTVPAVGYHLDSGRGSLLFSGDTTTNDALWQYANRLENLRHILIETAFPDEERALAEVSCHLCPSLLAEELRKLTRPAEIHITHLKPADIVRIMEQVRRHAGDYRPRMLRHRQTFDF